MAQAYKLGFEFQEANNLAIFATEVEDKKPLFRAYSTLGEKKLLWSLEKDNRDFEFVTPPFIVDESTNPTLELSIFSIAMATNILQTEVACEKDETIRNMNKWVELIINNIKYIKIEKTDYYKNFIIKRINSSNYPLSYQPQVTFQYPINYTIPLFFGLMMSSETTKNLFNDVPTLLKGLPSFNGLLGKQESQFVNLMQKLYTTKIYNFSYFMALTMAYMAQSSNKQLAFSVLTKAATRNDAQIDAKMNLLFMSRRPFSMMLKELGGNESQRFEAFKTTYDQILYENKLFLSPLKGVNTPFQFIKAIYGEYKKNKLNITYETLNTDLLCEFFSTNEEELGEIYQILISQALNNNALLTAFIYSLANSEVKYLENNSKNMSTRNFWLYCYRNDVLLSMPSPSSRFYFQVLNNDILKPRSYSMNSYYDYFSPPLFLAADDSMGYLKNQTPETTVTDINIYGSCVVECRGIRDVGTAFAPWNVDGTFLAEPKHLCSNATKLYNFLLTLDEKIQNGSIFKQMYNNIPQFERKQHEEDFRSINDDF